MLLFSLLCSGVIGTLLALMHKENKNNKTYDTRLVVFIKSTVVSFIIIYFACTFFPPQSLYDIAKTQEIELGDPDF